MRARHIRRVLLFVLVFVAAVYGQTSHIEGAAQLLASGDTVRAEAEARAALQDPSTKALALAMLGTIRLQQGKADDSIKFLTQALALNSKLVGARTTLGNAYAFAGKMDLAAKCFREVLNADPGNLNARFDLFKLEAARRNFQQSFDVAAPIFHQLVTSDEGLVILASDYGALGKKQELQGLVPHWQKLAEPSDDAALDFATTLMANGMRPEATSVLEQEEKRLTAHPQSGTALRLAFAFSALGVFDRAENSAQLALSLDPQCTACYQGLAQIAERQNNSEK